ncbi:MAG: Hsp20/alpha crystallin family protein [Chloroflexi bacterium]|nr:MAG: Hsp20/alpha crystallin family protein [Chloroflexota bacterium]
MYRRRPFGYYHSINPWREIEQIQREMNRMFRHMSTGPRVAPGYPAINVWANDEGVVVTAELPGVKTEDIDISVVGNTLTLSGERRPDELKDGEKYHRRERRQGKFTRTFELPFGVEADKVEAMFERGVLHISLPRAEAEKPRKIAVKSAN